MEKIAKQKKNNLFTILLRPTHGVYSIEYWNDSGRENPKHNSGYYGENSENRRKIAGSSNSFNRLTWNYLENITYKQLKDNISFTNKLSNQENIKKKKRK